METSETQNHDQTANASEEKSQAENQGATDQNQTETDWKAEAEKWKALSRKNEDQAKANSEKAKAWDEWQESQKTEEQKRDDQIKKISSERDEALARAAKFEAATKYGLSADDLELLGGGSPESFDERAKALAERLKGSGKPGRDPNLGLEDAGPSSSNDWIRQSLKY